MGGWLDEWMIKEVLFCWAMPINLEKEKGRRGCKGARSQERN